MCDGATVSAVAIDDAEVVRLDEGSFAAIDLGGWAPRLHFLTGGGVAADLSGHLRTIGLVQDRLRELQLRETRLLRVDVGCGMSTRGRPQSVVVDADVAAGDRIATGISALEKAQIVCSGVTLRSSRPVDTDAVSKVVRLLYGLGQHRVRLVFGAGDVSSQRARTQLISLLRDLWSIQPVMEMTWTKGEVDVLREPIWHEVATRLRIRGYTNATPEVVWSSVGRSRCEVEAFEISDDPDRRSADVKWLVEAYERDLVVSPEICSPYSEILAGFREPRVAAPSCVRLRERRLLVDDAGAARCCPTAVPVAAWEVALLGDRHWDCAKSWMTRMATGCCNSGRVMRRDCRGSEPSPCPNVHCEFARMLLPVVLRRLRESMVESLE